MRVALMMFALSVSLVTVAQNEQRSAPKHASNSPYRIMIAGDPSDSTPNGQERELVRSKLISSLSKECKQRCVVAEQAIDDDTKVDAILTGSWQIEECWNCRPRMQGAMRLVAKDGTVLWSDTVYSSRFARSITSSFADEVAKKLVSSLASEPPASAAGN